MEQLRQEYMWLDTSSDYQQMDKWIKSEWIENQVYKKLSLVVNNEKILKYEKFAWWLTNEVYLVELEWGKKVVIKIWEDLSREETYFWFFARNWISNSSSILPKLLDSKNWWNTLVLEFREWMNWKDIVDFISDMNWETIWEKFWKSLKDLHWVKANLSKETEIVESKKMLDYVSIHTQVFSQSDYNRELELLKNLIWSSSKDFVMLHWDFSPHNCLFTWNENEGFNISTILDPSWRVWFWINYFDIVYLFNTRWNRNKWKLKEWFLKEYEVDLSDPLFIQFEKVMKMYLIELYYSMWDENFSQKLSEKLLNNIKTWDENVSLWNFPADNYWINSFF